ncbi:MAG: C25 family cysteine peptidase [Candidatus Zipacnadales bacterium]
MKLVVSESGLQEVVGRELADLGIDLASVPAEGCALLCGGQPVPLQLIEEGATLTETSRLRFWGETVNSKFTRENAYWLVTDGVPQRMVIQRPETPSVGEPLQVVRSHLRFEENHQYAYLLLAPDKAEADHWLWHKLAAKEKVETHFDLPDLAEEMTTSIRIELRGSTNAPPNPDHHTVIRINGELVEDVQWEGAVLHQCERPLPIRVLKAEDNVLSIENVGDTAAGEVDTVYLNGFEVTYSREAIARDGSLVFYLGPSPTPLTVRIRGFETSAELYDITDPLNPVIIPVVMEESGVLRAMVPCATERRLAAISETAIRHPEVRVVYDAGLRSPENAADYLIVAPEALIPPLSPLVSLRQEQGLRVVVAPLEAVYNELGQGVATPLAIRELVRYAVSHWQQPAPRLLFLVGDATYDYLDYLGTGVANQVPTYLVTVGYNIETPNDDWFGCLEEGIHGPALAVGRLPARTAGDVEVYVRKVLAYESAKTGGDWRRHFVFLADHDLQEEREGPYETFQRRLAERLGSEGYEVQCLTLRSAIYGNNAQGVRPDLVNQLTAAIDKGCGVLVYQGHGDEYYWSRERVLTLEDVEELKNAPRLPVVVEISCFTGAFDSPEVRHPSCIAEAFLLNPDGGAIACISAARLGGTNIDEPLLEALIHKPELTIGEAFQMAKAALGLSHGTLWELQATYNLLGDPAIRLGLSSLPPQRLEGRAMLGGLDTQK